MKIEIESQQSLSLERKIRMHEAREAIIDRLARDLPASIELERFLRVVVSEIGPMMNADRCDLIQLTEDGELMISHEWRAYEEHSPPAEGTRTSHRRPESSPNTSISTKPIVVNDTTKAKDAKVRFLAKALETHSLLVIPISINEDVIGLLGLHDTSAPRECPRRA